MKILVVCQYFYPEEFKVNDLVNTLVERGHEVTVLTGKPNYPSGYYYKGYKFWGITKEKYNGAEVIRIPLLNRGKGGSIRLFLNYFSYVLFANHYISTHTIKADASICFAQSPLTQMLPAIKLKKKNAAKATLWVQDLWPESVWAASGKYNRTIDEILSRIVKYIYKNTDTLFVQSKGFKDSVIKHGVSLEKIVYVPNWAEDIYLDTSKIDYEKYRSLIPSGFVIMYAGNIGAAQDIPSILEAAKIVKTIPEIQFVIVGDGRERLNAEKIVKEYSLESSVHFLGRYSFNEMPSFFVHADAMISSLKDEEIFSVTIPSRIQAYMAFGKPVLTMLSGIGSTIVEEAKCGLTSLSGDYHKLAENILALYNTDKTKLYEMGQRGKLYYSENFEKNVVLDTIENHLK